MKKFLLIAASLVSLATSMQAQRISDLPAASSVADADLAAIVQGGVTKQATAALIRSGTVASQISDSTTVGRALLKLTNPSAVTFLRVNADNTVSALSASDFRTALSLANTVPALNTSSTWADVTAGGSHLWTSSGFGLAIVNSAKADVTVSNIGTGTLSVADVPVANSISIAPGETVTFSTVSAGGANYTFTEIARATDVRTTRTISTTSPLSGGGALSGNLTLSVLSANATQSGVVTTSAQEFAGDKTFTGNLSVQGSTSLGDAYGDAHAIRGSITAQDATAVGSANVANVGTLDSRFSEFFTGRQFYISTFTGATANVSGGSVTQGVLNFSARSNSGAGNRAAGVITVFDTSFGASSRGWQWNKKQELYVWFSLNGDNRGTVTFLMGQTSAYTSGNLTERGMGFTITGSTLTAVAHNGTTGSSYGTGSIGVSGNNWLGSYGYLFKAVSDGAGNVSFSLNGVDITGGTGGPTTVSSNSECFVAASVNSASTATVSDLQVRSILVRQYP